MKTFKALITDLDGTAVKLGSDGSDITQTTINAAKAAQNSGTIMTCATGRGWKASKPIAQKLGFAHPVIVRGGTYIVDPASDEILWEQRLDASVAEAIFEIYKQVGSGKLRHSDKVDIADIKNAKMVEDKPTHMYLLDLKKEVGEQLANNLNSLDADVVAHTTLSRAGEHMLDVHATHPFATKEHAINVWREMMRLDKSEVVAMGDSGNDIPAFNAVGFKVAVNNATDELKSLADYVIPDANQNSLEHVLAKFF